MSVASSVLPLPVTLVPSSIQQSPCLDPAVIAHQSLVSALPSHFARGAVRNKIQDLWSSVVHQIVRAPSSEGAVYTVAPLSDLNKTRNVHRDMLKAVVPSQSADSQPLGSPSPPSTPPVAPTDDSSGSELWFLVTEAVASPQASSQSPAAPLATLAQDRPRATTSLDHSSLPPTSSLSPSDQPGASQQELRRTARPNADCHPNVHHLPRPAGPLDQVANRPQGPVSNSQMAIFRPWRDGDAKGGGRCSRSTGCSPLDALAFNASTAAKRWCWPLRLRAVSRNTGMCTKRCFRALGACR